MPFILAKLSHHLPNIFIKIFHFVFSWVNGALQLHDVQASAASALLGQKHQSEKCGYPSF
jgi:hypothetical protein